MAKDKVRVPFSGGALSLQRAETFNMSQESTESLLTLLCEYHFTPVNDFKGLISTILVIITTNHLLSHQVSHILIEWLGDTVNEDMQRHWLACWLHCVCAQKPLPTEIAFTAFFHSPYGFTSVSGCNAAVSFMCASRLQNVVFRTLAHPP